MSRGDLVLRLRRPEVSLRVSRRTTVVTAVLLGLTLVAVCAAAAFGDYPVSLAAVARTVLGRGTPVDDLVIGQFRLPRIAEAVLVGAALGSSGAVFQSLARNPLAAPDVVGVNEGAAVAAVWLLLAGAPADVVPVGAFLGALSALAVVALLGVRRRLSIYRILLIGLGVTTVGDAVVAYLLTHTSRANFERLQIAQQWLVGNLSGATWHAVRLLGIALLLAGPTLLACARHLDPLAIGDDLATSLGVRLAAVQLFAAGLAALLAATAVSAAGPIGFVAFISPHLARRLTRQASAASLLLVSAAMGGLLVLLADYAAQRVFEPAELPVGVTTALIGAPYLLLLVLRGERRAGMT